MRVLGRTPIGRQAIEAINRVKAVTEAHDALAANDALFEAGRDARRKAQTAINDGDKAEADRLLAEARYFESAAQGIPGV